MSVHAWIIVAGDPAMGNLIEVARSLGGKVSAAVVGTRAVADAVAAGGVDRVVWFGEPGERPVEAYASAVADTVGAEPGVLIGALGPSSRVLVGAAAARLQGPVLTGASAISVSGGSVLATRSIFGGIAEETVTVDGPVAFLLDGGAVPTATGSAPVDEISAAPLPMTVVQTTSSAFELVDLGSARRVVAVGRGLKDKADLELVTGLAKAADAEVACSRPLAEGLDWFGKDSYIGVSGQHIAPELYVAVGISGQLQHMVGVREATTIVAINTDAGAPIFAEADYGLVGDLYQILPALIEALG